MIIIGVMTCNRMNILKLMAQSLYHTDMTDCEVRIYDDCSDDYGVEELKTIFPNAVITRHEKRLGADKNMLYMYEDFLKSGYDYLLNADSDLIFNKNWRKEALSYIEKTDGILSLFNTLNHLIIEDLGDILIKQDVGAAGVFFKRNIIEFIVDKIKAGIDQKYTLDWEWNFILIKNNIRIMAVKNSLVQHIGIEGLWSKREYFDYGYGFLVDEINGQILNEVIKNLSNNVENYRKRAEIYFNRKQYALALNETNEIIKKAPKMAIAYLSRSCELAAMGRFKEAKQDLEFVKNLNPENDDIKKNYEQLNKYLSSQI